MKQAEPLQASRARAGWQSWVPLTLAALPFGIQVVGGGHGVGGGEGPALGDCHQNGAVPGVRAAKPEHKQATFNAGKRLLRGRCYHLGAAARGT